MFNSPPTSLQAALLAAFLPRPAATQSPPPGPDAAVTVHGHQIAIRPEQLAETASVVESISSTIRAR